MGGARSILIVGGGTAGWLTAAYLARALKLPDNPQLSIRLLESPEIGIVGVGEGTFPTIRSTLRFLGIDEARFIRATTATFKQGIRFVDWAETPQDGRHDSYFHPFEPPFYSEDADIVSSWLLQDPATRPPFAEAVTIQNRVAEAQRGPKRPHEEPYGGPLNYAYHVDAVSLSAVLAERARELGVVHLEGRLDGAVLDERGHIAHIVSPEHGTLAADLFVDCTGFRAELIGRALDVPFRDVRRHLFTDRAIACKKPHDRPDAPLESFTVATAHEAGWIWDIGLTGARGIGCVYSSDHIDDACAEAILADYVGPAIKDLTLRRIPFEAGWRERQWVGNCVAVGLSGGFLEPLESTGVVMIEAAAGMIAAFLPRDGAIDGPARRFNQLMTARYETIVTFLKLHYCLSRRREPFWRENADPASWPERLVELLDEWRYRPPSRFDFILDVESFAFFNYQYILYGMGFVTQLSPVEGAAADAARLFSRIRSFGERAAQDLPGHRELIRQIIAAG